MAESDADWRLPPGVARGAWRYVTTPEIATEYDADVAAHPLLEFDDGVLQRVLDRPGLLVDFGCGTGRSLLPFAARGFPTLGVDLSRPMLDELGRKTPPGAMVDRVQANLVELDGLRDGIADYVVCLFSTLGMIRGRVHRRAALAHMSRILKPSGRFVLHLHNRWANVGRAAGRAWLAASWWESVTRRGVEFGDKVYPYRGLPDMFLHVYSASELSADLRAAGLAVDERIALGTRLDRSLSLPWLLPGLRAGGWIVVGRRET